VVIGPSLASDLIRAFLGAEFSGGERYVKRLEKIKDLERNAAHA
jgi:ribose 5-phosphate isomerase B